MARTEDGSYLHTLTTAEGKAVCELLSRLQPQNATADFSEVLNRDL